MKCLFLPRRQPRRSTYSVVLVILLDFCSSTDLEAPCGLPANTEGDTVVPDAGELSDDNPLCPSLVQQSLLSTREAVPMDAELTQDKTQKTAHGDDRAYAVQLLIKENSAGDVRDANLMKGVPRISLAKLSIRDGGMKLLEVLLLTATILIASVVCFLALCKPGQAKKEQLNASTRSSSSEQRQQHPSQPIPSRPGTSMGTEPSSALSAGRPRQYHAQKFHVDTDIYQAAPTPSTVSLPPKTETAPGTLCPELVVPDNTECTLRMQRLPPRGAARVGSVALKDSHGKTVFQASFDLGRGLVRGSRRLTLTNPTSDAVFAFCCDGHDVGSGLTIFNGNAAPFGQLHRAEGDGVNAVEGYVVRCNRGYVLNILGDVVSGNMNIADREGRLLAMAEPVHHEEGSRGVRVGPFVDAGLVAIALLGIDILEFLKSEHP